MKILIVKQNTLVALVHRLEEQIPFQFSVILQLRTGSQRREVPWPSLDSKRYARVGTKSPVS